MMANWHVGQWAWWLVCMMANGYVELCVWWLMDIWPIFMMAWFWEDEVFSILEFPLRLKHFSYPVSVTSVLLYIEKIENNKLIVPHFWMPPPIHMYLSTEHLEEAVGHGGHTKQWSWCWWWDWNCCLSLVPPPYTDPSVPMTVVRTRQCYGHQPPPPQQVFSVSHELDVNQQTSL